mgnify:CR=1 FL=1
MRDHGTGDARERPAGGFAAWLDDVRAAIDDGRATDVPCDGCVACCTSSQFVHIAPDETETLAHIPAELLFPAPRMPKGHMLLGYDEHGRCPMLVDDRCSIYAHRPRTCRTYDCRVFAAADVEPDDDKPSIAARVRQWRFDLTTDDDRRVRDAVRAAARFVDAHRDELPARLAPANRTQLAVLAVRSADVFLADATPEPTEAIVEITRRAGKGSRPA